MSNRRWCGPALGVAAAGLAALAACSDNQQAQAPPVDEVVARVDPASTTECPFGGSVVRSGADRNGNGALDAEEVEGAIPLCNPAPIEAPPIVLRLIAEPSGDNCAHGGSAVKSGPDRNGNGVLDEDEITRVDYVCGALLVTRMRAQAAGPGCESGGVAFEVGLDGNGDGVLGDDEVAQTDLTCGDVLARDVVIGSAADAAALAKIEVINGSLTIEASGLGELVLPALTVVRGGLEIRHEPALTRIALPALVSLDGRFALIGNAQLARVDVHRLARVGSLVIDGNPRLPDLTGLSALGDIAGDLQITHNDGLATFDVPYHGGFGRATIDENAQLAEIALDLHGHVGPLHIGGNAALGRVTLGSDPFDFVRPELDQVTIDDNAQLTAVSLNTQRIDAIAIDRNPALASVAIDTFALPGALTLRDNGPASVDLQTLAPLPFGLGALVLSGPITALHVPASLAVAGDCTLDATQLVALDPPTAALACAGALHVTRNASLTQLPSLAAGGDVELRGNAAIASLTVSGNEIAGDLIIADNAALHDVTLAPDRVTGGVTITGNPLLETVAGDALNRVDGALVLEGDDALRDPGLGDLRSVGSLAVSRCGALAALALPVLGHVTSRIDVRDNASLSALALPVLRQADMAVTDNPRLPACAVDALFAGLAGDHQQSGNDTTTECAP